jgi:hypothetical protein
MAETMSDGLVVIYEWKNEQVSDRIDLLLLDTPVPDSRWSNYWGHWKN